MFPLRIFYIPISVILLKSQGQLAYLATISLCHRPFSWTIKIVTTKIIQNDTFAKAGRLQKRLRLRYHHSGFDDLHVAKYFLRDRKSLNLKDSLGWYDLWQKTYLPTATVNYKFFPQYEAGFLFFFCSSISF